VRCNNPSEAERPELATGDGVLKLRPNCEYCDRDLPPDSRDARICSYECTFCADCVETHLSNVCPNCGGGFEHRPVRPRHAHRDGVSLMHQPASTERVSLKRDKAELSRFAARLRSTPPDQR
jgi:hypothetical protein